MENQQRFKSSEILISRIKENLSSYDSAGIVDSGKFYFYIKKELQLLGNYIYTEKQEVLKVENNKCLLPNDFIKLYALYEVEGAEQKLTRSGIQNDITFVQHIESQHYREDNCEPVCETDKKVVRYTNTMETLEVIKPLPSKLLRYSRKVNTELCLEDSPNVNSTSLQEFNIDNNYLYFNFEKGRVFLQYLGFPYDDEGYPMIPDDSKLEQAIEDYIMFKVFEYFYLNDTINNALQKMQYLEMKYKESHKSALNYIKLPAYQDLVDMAYRNVKNRFNIFEVTRNGQKPYSTSDRNAEGQGYFPTRFPRI